VVSELDPSAARSIPQSRAPHGRTNPKADGAGDPDVRVTLSPAALRSAAGEPARETPESAAPETSATPETEPEPEATMAPPRRHPADAYRETPRPPRGERVRIVV